MSDEAGIRDEQLVKNYRQGDEAALEILVARYLPMVYRLAFRYVGGRAEAEDVTQETFLKAWRFLNKFDTEKSFKAWLLTIARNACLDWLRKKKAGSFAEFSEQQEQIVVGQMVDPGPLPQQFIENADTKKQLDLVLCDLPEKYRLAVELHITEDLTFKEIGELLDEPLDTVKSRYFRALRMLKDRLSEKDFNK